MTHLLNYLEIGRKFIISFHWALLPQSSFSLNCMQRKKFVLWLVSLSIHFKQYKFESLLYEYICPYTRTCIHIQMKTSSVASFNLSILKNIHFFSVSLGSVPTSNPQFRLHALKPTPNVYWVWRSQCYWLISSYNVCCPNMSRALFFFFFCSIGLSPKMQGSKHLDLLLLCLAYKGAGSHQCGLGWALLVFILWCKTVGNHRPSNN